MTDPMQHTLEKSITWGELDALGIVFYPRYYEWMDEAAHAFFDSLGINLGTLWKGRNIQFGLVETGCRYLSPGRYFDKVCLITTVEELRAKSLTLAHRIYRMPEHELMVDGFERRICLDVSDPAAFKATHIPEDIHQILSSALKGPSSTRA